MFKSASKTLEMPLSEKRTFQHHVWKGQFEEAARMAEDFLVPADLQEEFGRLLAQSEVQKFRTLLKAGVISQDVISPEQGDEIASRVGLISCISFANHFFEALDPVSKPAEGIFILSLNDPQVDGRIVQPTSRYQLN